MADTTPNLATCRPSLRTVTGWTIFFMVLLRIAIGWHFFYEGAWKLAQPDWRATSYLTASTGPLRPIFRWMVWDVDGLERMTKESITQRIDDKFDTLVEHYGLTDDQTQKLALERDQTKKEAKEVIDNTDFQLQLADYKKLLEEIKDQEKNLGSMDYNTERLVYNYGKKNTAMNALLERVEKPLKDLESKVVNACSPEQLAAGAPPIESSQTEFIDWANMLALTGVGIGLMLGIFTPLSALGGIGLLALYYFCMFPWPGYPENPQVEGHYLIVNKNLIEMIALLVIMTSRVGRWGGLDALISAWLRKKREPKMQTTSAQ
ncbi:MAG: DoxX family protein [Planctomycetota bacterium]|nr:MAG: DoxX family protein [Planctomycetota bacterium]